MKIMRVSHQANITAEPAELFDFHAYPGNARLILPPTTTGFQLREGGTARQGEAFHITCREWGVIPLSWRGRWEKVEYPRLLVDVAEQSPFAFWRHRHEFIKAEHGSLLIDTVEIRFGKGWLGWLITFTVIRMYLKLFFLWRHWRTRLWFNKVK